MRSAASASPRSPLLSPGHGSPSSTASASLDRASASDQQRPELLWRGIDRVGEGDLRRTLRDWRAVPGHPQPRLTQACSAPTRDTSRPVVALGDRVRVLRRDLDPSRAPRPHPASTSPRLTAPVEGDKEGAVRSPWMTLRFPALFARATHRGGMALWILPVQVSVPRRSAQRRTRPTSELRCKQTTRAGSAEALADPQNHRYSRGRCRALARVVSPASAG